VQRRAQITNEPTARTTAKACFPEDLPLSSATPARIPIFMRPLPRDHIKVSRGEIACAKVPVALAGGLLMAQRKGTRTFTPAAAEPFNDCSCTLAVNDSQSGGGLQTLRVWALKGNSSRECHRTNRR
jgi:hypothetical protein